ncbi:MAG: glycosylhydrolase-like jelly roll fold domain-containing protein, partial [Bacteroidia bacterium]
YGHQGYHGLKGNMYDNFIRLGALAEEKHSKIRKPEAAGNFYLLYSKVIAPEDGDFELLTGTEKPANLFINGVKTEDSASAIHLKKGANPILAVYNKACETHLVFRRKDAPRAQKQQLCMSWYHDYGVLQYDYSGQQNSSGIFAFESAPGLQTLSFQAYGKVAVWADGIQQETLTGSKQADGLTSYTVQLKTPKAGTSQVVFKIDFLPGYRGAAALPEFIRQSCGKGSISLGDWSEIDGLKAYSGGAWYRKTITLKPEDLTNKLELDLGNLVSSAEVLINGKSAGIKLALPWKFDITKLAKSGENKIEVLIYNTLANNYTTIPTRYRGSIRSGLIGPVMINLNQ